MGVENGTGTDTRTETTDKPPSQDRPSAPPPDNPGSPGQPSRLESRARAREAQQAEAQDAGSPPRDNKPGPSQTQKPETSPASQPVDRDQDTDSRKHNTEDRETDRPGQRDQANGPPPDNPGSPGQASRLESIARAREAQQANAARRPETGNGQFESTEEHDAQPVSQIPATNEKPQATTDTEAQRPDEPGDRDNPRLLPQEDGPRAQPAGQPSHSDKGNQEQPTDTGEQPSPQEDTAPPATADVPTSSTLDDSPDLADAQSEPEAEPTSQKPEIAAPAPDTGNLSDKPGSQRNTEDAHTSPEETTQDGEKPSPYGDHGVKRDEEATEAGTGETGERLDPSGRRSDLTREEEEPGSELTPQGENATEVEQPSRFAGRVKIMVDSDGSPIPEHRHTETDDPNRGELRRPEDDPASRDYQARDPERRSRRRDFLRAFVTKAGDTRDAADAVSKPAQRGLERVQPTGQSSGARPGPDQVGPREQPAKAGSVLIGGVGMAIVLTEAIRYGIKSAKGMIEREHAGNR